MKNIFLFLLVILHWSCEKTALSTQSDSLYRPVVECFLQPGVLPTVYVKQQIAYGSSDSLQQPVLGLSVYVEDLNSGLVYPLVHTDSSAYVADGSWQPEAGVRYALRFEYQGQSIRAESTIPSKPLGFTASATSIAAPNLVFTPGTPPSFPDPVSLTWDNSDGGYYLIVAESAEASPKAIYDTTSTTGPGPGAFRRIGAFRSEPEQISQYELEAVRFEYYGLHRIILYHLNAEYAALYEDSGNNSQNLSTPYTNVTNGLGIFTGIHADTLFLTVTK